MRGVVVLGVFRSGTSLVSRILAELGVDFGPGAALFGPTRFNPDGFFQRRDVLEANTRFIGSAGSSVALPSDPEVLLQNGDVSLLRGPDLGWRGSRKPWGLKDPRFSATLLSWVEAGILARNGLRLVQVSRDASECARSILSFPPFAQLLPEINPDNVQTAVRRYSELAEWHIRRLGVPAIRVQYEQLTSEPRRVIQELAEFIGTGDQERNRDAALLVGKEHALMRYYIRGSV
ncbi:MAG: hypothetical protein HYU77_08545 [Betaproteobacteria bacterium]|nr:hypothetical protein [Betaproteobacteria bacterium]